MLVTKMQFTSDYQGRTGHSGNAMGFLQLPYKMSKKSRFEGVLGVF
jgi:hypothetical protein